MEGSEFSAFVPHLKRFAPAIVLGILGVSFIGYGILAMQGQSEQNDGIVFQEAVSSEKALKPTVEVPAIVVDIQGAVVKPGVYRFKADTRMEELIREAGGYRETVNKEWVAKELNLASKLTDGMKVYVPFNDEQAVAGVATLGTEGERSVSINNASATVLEGLPGIGPVTAGKIIDNRPYNSLEELLSKKIIGEKTFEKIRNQLVL